MVAPWLVFLLLLSITTVCQSRIPFLRSSHRVPPPTSDAVVLEPTNRSSSNHSAPLPLWKQSLPTELQEYRSLNRLKLGSVTIYLLGTAHVSLTSQQHVEQLLQHVQPQAILVELCDARIPLLTSNNDTKDDTATTEKGTSRWQALGTNLLTRVQDDYAQTLGVELGAEFRAAHQYWKDSGDCHLILGDRAVQITLQRAWESLHLFNKFRLIVALLWSALWKPNEAELRAWLERIMKEGDVLTSSLQDLRKAFPTLYDTIIAERDAYLAAKIVQSCRSLANCEFVVIVGAGHVPGILEWLIQPQSSTPEHVLHPLVQTKRFVKDSHVQEALIPEWVNQVTVLQP